MAQNLKEKRFTMEFTRPTGGVPYTAQDGVFSSSSGTTVLPLLPVQANDIKGQWLVSEGSYQIKQTKLSKSTASTTNASFDVYFYTSGITATQDNQPHNLKYSDKHVRIGKTSHTLTTADSSTSTGAESTNSDVNLSFIIIPPNSNILATDAGYTQTVNNAALYAQIVATAAYTPGSAEKFFLEVILIRIDE